LLSMDATKVAQETGGKRQGTEKTGNFGAKEGMPSKKKPRGGKDESAPGCGKAHLANAGGEGGRVIQENNN